jgi:hypothetical protein
MSEYRAANNSDRWTPEEDERLRQLLFTNTPPSEIAVTLGRTVPAVKSRVKWTPGVGPWIMEVKV